VETVLERDIFNRHVVLGPRSTAHAGARLDGLNGRVLRSGKDVEVPADLQANIGEVIEIVRHVGSVVAHFGDTLRAGQFIICGSITALQIMQASDTSFEWSLDPIGEISVQFR
jgi:2-keto-4-pentenoate hydratase